MNLGKDQHHPWQLFHGFQCLKSSLTDFLGLKNATKDFLGLKNATKDFLGLENATKDFLGLENATKDFQGLFHISEKPVDETCIRQICSSFDNLFFCFLLLQYYCWYPPTETKVCFSKIGSSDGSKVSPMSSSRTGFPMRIEFSSVRRKLPSDNLTTLRPFNVSRFRIQRFACCNYTTCQ